MEDEEKNFKMAIVIDIDSTRDKEARITIQSVNRSGEKGEVEYENTDSDTLTKMGMLCEGLCTLIHCAENEGIKSTADSLRDCIKHLESGSFDASYVGSTDNPFMSLNLDKYPTKGLLGSYKFFFGQYLGGQLTPPEQLEIFPSPYIVGEISSNIRKQYLEREDADIKSLEKVEKESVDSLVQMMNVPHKKLNEFVEKFIEEFKKSNNKN